MVCINRCVESVLTILLATAHRQRVLDNTETLRKLDEDKESSQKGDVLCFILLSYIVNIVYRRASSCSQQTTEAGSKRLNSQRKGESRRNQPARSI